MVNNNYTLTKHRFQILARPIARLVIACGALFVVGTVSAQELQLDALFQQGLNLVNEQLDAHGLELDSEAINSIPQWNDVVQFLTGVEDVLENGSIEQLAWYKPEIDASLVWLEQWPAAAPYTSWLREQADYFAVAEDVVAAVPEAPRRPPPAARPPARPLSLPPRPPAPPPSTRKKLEDTAQTMEVWKKRLASRPAPSGAKEYAPKLKSIFRANGIPEPLIWLAEVESGFNPKARSPVGAAGLFQFMPPTAQRFGLSADRPDDRLNPEKSAKAAAAYLRVLYNRFGSWPLALAGYNAGEGRVSKLMKQAQVSSFEGIAHLLPLETRLYVPKISAVIELRENIKMAEIPGPISP